jgi:spermidine synthase
MPGLLYLFFFLSGLSGLIYQVVWVRLFGNVFGNTLYSTSLVVAVFMLGLGVGSYVVGAWADRRYATQSASLLRTYGYFELAIGVLGLGLSVLLPHLGEVSALVSSYSRNPNGWYVLSTTSYLTRGAIAIVLLTPVTLLMGGTLALLIRHRSNVSRSGAGGSPLCSINTVARRWAACSRTSMVPASGLRGAQMVCTLQFCGRRRVVRGLARYAGLQCATHHGPAKADTTSAGVTFRRPNGGPERR